MNRYKFALILLLTAATAPVFAQVAADADPAKMADGQLQEIVVTAQRRSENVQKVPISVTTVTGDQIRPAAALSSFDLTQQVVGLQINKEIAGADPTIFMRGVGVNDFNPSSSGAIGVVVDDVFLASAVGQLFSLYDIDRVEVLRGPQGTLFGRNTTGGVLNYVTRKPTWDTEVDGAVTVGNYDTFDASGGISGTLVKDLLAGRLSFDSQNQGGYVTNEVNPEQYPGTVGNGAKLGGFNTWAVRGQLLFTLTSDLTVNVKVEGGRRDGTSLPLKSAGAFNNATGTACTPEQIALVSYCGDAAVHSFVSNPDPNVSQYNNPYNLHDQLKNTTAKLGVDWNVGSATLHSVSAYVRNNDDRALAQDATPYLVTEAPLAYEHSSQLSEELRLASNGDTQLKWQVGAFYLHELLNSSTYVAVHQYLDASLGTDFSPANLMFGLVNPYRQATDSWAVFTQESYKLTDKLTATGGLRFSQDRKVLDLAAYGTTNDTPSYTATNLFDFFPPQHVVTRQGKPTWRLSLDYQADDNLLLYGSYNRGFRSGGYNIANTSIDEFTLVKPERIDAFEAGVKADLFDRTLRINSSAFYYNYVNQQVFAFGGTGAVPVSILENANSRIYGGEVEVTALPVRNFKLHGGVAYTHARYTEIHDARGDFVGNTPEKTPTVQITADVSYGWDFTDRLRGSIGVDGSYQTKTYLDPSNQVDLVSPAHGLVNAHLEIASAADLTATMWVKNLADHRYIQDGFDFSALSGVDYIYNLPRTFGITIAYKM